MSSKSPPRFSYDSPKLKLSIQGASPRSSSTSTQRSRRLLIPIAHESVVARSPISMVRRTKSSSSGIKLTRAARGEADDAASTSSTKVYASQKPWWSSLGRFRLMGHMELEGYQIYAVQKWYANVLYCRLASKE